MGGLSDPKARKCWDITVSIVRWGCENLCNTRTQEARNKILELIDSSCTESLEPHVKMTASMSHSVDTHATTKTSSHQGAAPTPTPAAHRDSKKKCGRMFFKSCSTDGDCCSSHGWTCGKDKRCVWHHASLNELLPCDWLTKLTTNIAHLLSSKVCVVGSKFCGSDEQSKLAQLACKDIGLHDGNPLAKLCQGAAISALGKACSHFPQMCQGGISESANWLLAHVSPQCQSKGYKCTA